MFISFSRKTTFTSFKLTSVTVDSPFGPGGNYMPNLGPVFKEGSVSEKWRGAEALFHRAVSAKARLSGFSMVRVGMLSARLGPAEGLPSSIRDSRVFIPACGFLAGSGRASSRNQDRGRGEGLHLDGNL